MGEVVDAGAELGYPVTLLLGAVGLPAAVLLELGAVVLNAVIGPGAELVGVAGALLGNLGPAPHVGSIGSRRGRVTAGGLCPFGHLPGLSEGVRGALVRLPATGVGPLRAVPGGLRFPLGAGVGGLRFPLGAGVGGPGPIGLLLRLRPRRMLG